MGSKCRDRRLIWERAPKQAMFNVYNISWYSGCQHPCIHSLLTASLFILRSLRCVWGGSGAGGSAHHWMPGAVVSPLSPSHCRGNRALTLDSRFGAREGTVEIRGSLLQCGRGSCAGQHALSRQAAWLWPWLSGPLWLLPVLRVGPPTSCNLYRLPLNLHSVRSSVTFLLTAKTLADTFENKPGSGNLGRGPNSTLTCHLREVLHRWASLSSLWQRTPLVISKKILSKHWTIPWTLAKALFPCRAGGAEGKGGCEKHYKHIRLGGWLHREGNEVEWV